ncbi:hypothetical protein CQA62_02570 [Helicobacter cholecystus]|uniref:Uncharacterized protein n=1 Tax=Helicobacter cholecystus TaxID=45498 RepID=A0A3D8IYC0_9HELI|nr:zinc ABC transporter substrate-binding protein [Helicobacter cholecystus]RDU69551.1 hypothetical protein CQA62_02570 [Helicobacter cholecystus]VEJ24106.1 ABC transporter substrate-binding protein [Helicobacter cholecystus]
MKKLIFFFTFLFSLYGVESDFKIKVGVSILAQEYFLKKIGGDFVEVITIVPQSRNPSLYTPSGEQMKMIKNLSAYIAIGIPFEKRWIKRFTNANPSLRILDLSSPDCNDKICFSWLSISNAKEYAKKIAYILRAIDIKNSKIYKENLEIFLKELQDLEQQIREKLKSPESKKQFGAFQDTWDEYVKDFSLQVLDIANPQDLKTFKDSHLSFVFITPFNLKKQVLHLFPRSKIKLIEINPFSIEWKENLLKVTSYIAGEKNG